MLGGQLNRLPPVGSFPNDLQIRFLQQELPQSLPKNLMIIDEQDGSSHIYTLGTPHYYSVAGNKLRRKSKVLDI
jgi:hypothetical protein